MTLQAPDGAYIIGGGQWHFGQTMTEDLARAAFEFPVPTLGNMVELLATVLAQLPLDALKPFKDFLGIKDSDFQSISQAVQAIIDSLQDRPIFVTLKELVEAITGIINGDWSDLADWANDIKKRVDAFAGDLQALIEMVVDFITQNDLAEAIRKIIEAITGNVNGTLDTLKAWFKSNVVDNLGKLWDMIQQLIDGITQVFNPVAGINNVVTDAVNAIAGILGVGQAGVDAAAQANMGVSAILAAQAGGYSDEFDYTLASNLPAVWQKKNTTADTYGPSGTGTAVGVMSGTGLGTVWYVQTSKPLTTADMKVTGVLSRLPWWDLFVKSAWYLVVQANSTNQECYRVSIQNDRCQFQRVAANGAVTNIGALKTIPAHSAGIPYTFEIKGNTLSLYRNHILAASETVTGPFTGRMVGFGGEKVAYTNPSDNPLAQFAGIAWQTA